MKPLSDYATEVDRLSALISKGIAEMTHAGQAEAQAEHDYRKAKALAWTRAHRDLLAKEREAWVDSKTAPERMARDMASNRLSAAWEAVRARRAQLSALQSLLAAYRSEAELAGRGPT